MVGGAANATTVFNVTDNPGGQVLPPQMVSDGGTYGTQLTVQDSVSIDVSAVSTSTTGNLDFTFAPSPLNATISMILSSIDFNDFGPITATLSDGTSSSSGTVVAAGTELIFTGVALNSPLNVSFQWTNNTTGSFNADLLMSPVPLPAAGWMLLAGLGGIAALRRRQKVAS
jgi:hypothetical protein